MSDEGENTRRRLGRPPLTSPSAIMAAAREVGFCDLTVGSVTARVGVKHSTFYRHFPSLDALVIGLLDDTFDQLHLPTPDGDWSADLRSICAAMFDLYADHPGMVVAVDRLAELPIRLIEVFHHIADLLLTAGFNAQDAALGADTALEFVAAPWITANEDALGVVRYRYQAGPSIVRHRYRAGLIVRSHHQAATTAVGPDSRVGTVLAATVDDPPRDWTARKIEVLITALGMRLPAG